MDRREQFGVLVRGLGVWVLAHEAVSLPAVVTAVRHLPSINLLAVLWMLTYVAGSLGAGAVLFFAADWIVSLAYRVRNPNPSEPKS